LRAMMTRIKRSFLYYHLPAILYAMLIFYVSGLREISPPSLGISWDDKLYHFGEYFVFSLLIHVALRYYSQARIRDNIYVIGAIISVVFAVSDEIHQYFVPGRESSLLDLLADTLGAVLAQFVLWRFFKSRNAQKAID
jgi:VanZ family protein